MSLFCGFNSWSTFVASQVGLHWAYKELITHNLTDAAKRDVNSV